MDFWNVEMVMYAELNEDLFVVMELLESSFKVAKSLFCIEQGRENQELHELLRQLKHYVIVCQEGYQL